MFRAINAHLPEVTLYTYSIWYRHSVTLRLYQINLKYIEYIIRLYVLRINKKQILGQEIMLYGFFLKFLGTANNVKLSVIVSLGFCGRIYITTSFMGSVFVFIS
jgi:hypothetical protein